MSKRSQTQEHIPCILIQSSIMDQSNQQSQKSREKSPLERSNDLGVRKQGVLVADHGLHLDLGAGYKDVLFP